ISFSYLKIGSKLVALVIKSVDIIYRELVSVVFLGLQFPSQGLFCQGSTSKPVTVIGGNIFIFPISIENTGGKRRLIIEIVFNPKVGVEIAVQSIYDPSLIDPVKFRVNQFPVCIRTLPVTGITPVITGGIKISKACGIKDV